MSRQQTPWYRMEEGDSRIGDALQADASAMEYARAGIRANWLIYESFARGEPVSDLNFSMSRATGTWNPALADALDGVASLNVIGSVVETFQSMLFALQPFVTYDTQGAQHSVRMQAKRKTQFVDAVWWENGLYEQSSMSGRDGAVFGTGFIKGSVPNRKTRKIVLDRVNPDCLLFDLRDSAKDKPRRLIHRDYLQKDVAKAVFKGHDREIDSAGRVYGFLSPGVEYDDWVCVMDGYWLDPENAKSGVHVIAVGNHVVFWEKWELGRLPIAKFRYGKVSSGLLGKGVVQDLLNLQCQLDENERNIADGHRKMAHAKILQHLTSEVPASEYDDQNGTIIRWTGEHPPAFITPNAFTPEVYARSLSIISQMLQRCGLNEMMLQGKKPAGLDSAPSLREAQDQSSQRFLSVGEAYERFHVDIAMLVDDLGEHFGSKATAANGEVISVDEFKGASLKVCRAFPVSKLPSSPAAKKQQIEEDFRKGLLSREDYLRLRQYPDTDAWTNEEVAPRILIEEQLDKIMDGGAYEAPNPYQDSAMALEVALKRHNRAVSDGEPDRVLTLLELYIEQARANLQGALMQRQQLSPSPNQVQALVPQ